MLIVAFDPGASTGFCVVEDRQIVLSGQCDFPDAFARVFQALGKRAPDGVGIEYPFIPKKKKGEKQESAEGRAAAALQVGWKTGVIFGRSVTLWPTATMWQPRPAEWRSYIGIKGRDRKTIAANCVLWASATLRVELPPAQHDRAMAVGIAAAMGDYLLEKAAQAKGDALARARAKGAA